MSDGFVTLLKWTLSGPLAGALLGVLAGAEGGGLFALLYKPHGGGEIGDWTGITLPLGLVILGLPMGALAGIVRKAFGWPAGRFAVAMLLAGPLLGLLYWLDHK